MTGFDFHSDNAAGVHPTVMDAVAAASAGLAAPYGTDDVTARLDPVFSDLFETACHVFPVPTGTAANGLALGALTPAYGAIFAHRTAHVVTTECGAPEFFSNGARLVGLDGEGGRIDPDALSAALNDHDATNPHHLLAATLSLTQATEAGTLYDLDALSKLTGMAKAVGLGVHMDGARFANALVAQNIAPADMSWRAGVDILSFGATKNGTMNVEAVVVFDPDLARVCRYLHKRAGFLSSKMRFNSAQLLAYVAEGLWLENARAANRDARRLAGALAKIPGSALCAPVETNHVFIHLPPEAVRRLSHAGFRLRPWPRAGKDCYRLVTSFQEHSSRLDAFEAACGTCLAPAAR